MLDLGGTYRSVSPEDTLNKIHPMLWDVFGITRVANVTGLDDLDIPTYIAIRPDSKILSTSQGKGITHDLAKVSAIMESIESWHAERLAAPKLFGSYRQLKSKHRLINLETVLSGYFSLARDDLEQIEFGWASGTELNTGQEIYFPMSLLDLDSYTIDERKSNFFPPTSNGLASGNTFEEALCHALYEVIERHSWVLAESLPPRYVEYSTITASHIVELLERANNASVQFKIRDMTSDLGVPAYSAVLFDSRGTRQLDYFIGAGAHLSSVVALSRAITEAIQSRLTMISGSRDDIFPATYRFKRRFIKKEDNFHLLEKIPFIETTPPHDFSSCIDELLSRLKQQGFNQVIVYNHTRDDVGIPVVHVIVPGVAFDWFKHKTQAYLPDFFCDQAR